MTLSVLDTSPIVDGSTAQQALRETLDLARLADRLGYHRYWVAELHGMRGVAANATAVLVAEIANATGRIRVGAGGVMLPNHPPLLVAEQFGTLDALHPGRIDLAVGRAGGGSRRALDRIRPDADRSTPGFRRQIEELVAYFAGPGACGFRVPVPEGRGLTIRVLGSSPDSGALAGELGLPYVFGAHIDPARASESVAEYRTRFDSRFDDGSGRRPYVAVATRVIAADTAAHAQWLAGSIRAKTLSRKRGQRILLPDPRTVHLDADADELASLTAGFAIGDPGDVRAQLQALLDDTDADELIVQTPVFRHAERRRSYEIVAGLRDGLRFGYGS